MRLAIASFLLSGTVVGLIGYAYLTLTNEKETGRNKRIYYGSSQRSNPRSDWWIYT